MQLLGTISHTSEVVVEARHRFEVIDLTDAVEEAARAQEIRDGLIVVFCRHTTCGVLINELEDGLSGDFATRLWHLVPEGYFAHDDLTRRTQNLQNGPEPPNGAAHVRQMFLNATSQTIPIRDGELALGRWQRVLFVEFDEPRPRTIWISLLGSS